MLHTIKSCSPRLHEKAQQFSFCGLQSVFIPVSIKGKKCLDALWIRPSPGYEWIAPVENTPQCLENEGFSHLFGEYYKFRMKLPAVKYLYGWLSIKWNSGDTN